MVSPAEQPEHPSPARLTPAFNGHRIGQHSPTPAPTEFPAGLTGFERMPYGYRRWNGLVWAEIQVNAYNAELVRIEARHNAGMPTETLVNGLYNLAAGFDAQEAGL